MTTNPIHRDLEAGTWWTTNNMREAIPGVPTPLTWSIWERGSLLGTADMLYRLGTAELDEARSMASGGFGIVYGRPVACVNFTMSVMSRMPGVDAEAFTEAIFGIPKGTVEFEQGTPLGVDADERRATTAATQVATTRSVADGVRARWSELVSAPADNDALALVREGVSLFIPVYTEHLVMTSLSLTAFTDVATLAAQAGLPGLERRLVTGYGGLEESKIADDLWRLATGELTTSDFIGRHGYHGPNEGEVASSSWRETPEIVDCLAAHYRRQHADDPTVRQRRQATEREAAEAQLLAALPDADREGAKEILDRARSWVPAREVGKGGFLIALDVVRMGARALGRQLVRDGVLDDASDIFMFTIDELEELDALSADARTVAAARAALRADYLTSDVPSVFEGMPPRVALGHIAEVGDDITGVPVSPGRVVGVARVITDPTRAEPICPGEILVCTTTDPGWVSIFLDAAALVIDIGQAMSHGAIVARELGIPCVIDTKVGTARIADGATVEVDGDTGVVRVLDSVPTDAVGGA